MRLRKRHNGAFGAWLGRAIFLIVLFTAPALAQQPPSAELVPPPTPVASGGFPADLNDAGGLLSGPTDRGPKPPWEIDGCEDCGDDLYHPGWAVDDAHGHKWWHDWFGRRHSSTHGRAIGAGRPLRGTSWLNRPFEVAAEFGALVMAGEPAAGVRSGNDAFAAIHAGWDWDHYWGGQVRFGWSTPELDNPAIASADESDNLFIADVSVLYYPWGDSRTRPYCRLGMGLTDIEFTNAALARQQEQLFTIPIAVGIKHQMRRTLVWRAEFANNIAIGQNDANTIDNITLTFGVEGRFGGRPQGYWAWRSKHGGW